MNWRTLTGPGQPPFVLEGVKADTRSSRETTVEIQTAAGWDTNPSVEVHLTHIVLKGQFTQKSLTHPCVILNPYD